MRKKFLVFLIAVLACALCGLFTACESCNDDPPAPKQSTIELDRTDMTLDVLAREKLTATVKDGDGNAVSGEVSWTSSDEAVATVSGGVVTALSAGQAQITATCGEASAVCEVKVENNGLRPQLQLSAVTLDLKTGETGKIVPSVKFKTSVLDNAEYSITYTFTASEGGVVSVGADGTVTAIKYGTATVTVKADWAQATAAGLDGSLTGQVTVNVVAPYTLEIDFDEGYGQDIYLAGATDGDAVYRETTVIKVTKAEYNKTPITSGLVFKSGDVSVATVDANGVVTVADGAAEGDTVDVWAEYPTENEGVLTSQKITLTVRKAIVGKALQSELIADISVAASLPLSEIFSGDGVELLSVYDAEDTAKKNIYDKTENAYREVEFFGQRKWILESQKISYRIDVLVVSKVIMTAQDFAVFDNAAASSREVFKGYYILGANIDASSLTFANKGYPSYGDGIGLTGIFDGRGYTVDGLSLPSGGIFGVVASTGGVKNVAFTNVSINAGTNGLGLLFGWYFVGRLENVYIGINEYVTEGTSASASLGLFAACNEKTVLRNVVVVISAQAKYGATVSASQQFGSLAANTNRGAWENTFVVSSMRMFGGENTHGDEATTYAKSVQRFESSGEMLASEFYSSHKKAFGEMWDKDTMTMVSSAEYFVNEVDGLPENIEISVGNSVTVTPNCNAYVIALSEQCGTAGITLANGVITATKFAPSDSLSLTVAFGSKQKTISIKINNSINVEDYTYTYNLADGEDFIITDSIFAEDDSEASITVKGTDGQDITIAATVSDGALKADKSAFTGKLPSGIVSLSATVKGATIGINGVKLVYAVNTVDEFMAMADHLTLADNKYGGSIIITSDMDFDGKTFDGALANASFDGEVDGGNKTLKNVNVTATRSGAFFGTLTANAVIKNVTVKNAVINSYCGVICYENYGTIENCYVKGSIPQDVVTASPDNFGAGLLAGKNRNGSHVRNCIVELVSKNDTLYISGAFGKLGDGSAAEAKIFENCYAVAADNFALMTYGANRTTKNFEDNNGNRNFATVFALLEDETACVLAQKLGVTAPVVASVVISEESVTIYIDATATLKAEALTADGEKVTVEFVWSTDNGEIATVENGVVTGVGAGTAQIKATYGNFFAQCAVTVVKPALEDLVLENFSYAFNGSSDFTVTGEFPEAETITAKIKGLDGQYVTLTGITVSEGTLTIPAAQFAVANIPTKAVEMSLYFDGDEMIVRGVNLTYTVNTVEEWVNLRSRLTSTAANVYDGSVLLGADLDFTGVSFANETVYPMFRKTFNGVLDGGNHTLSNVTVNGSASGAFCGTLNGTVKNLIIKNASITTYCGVICDLNYGTIENCYVQGSVVSDGVTASSDNFGAGLLAARNRNKSHVRNCIVELVEKGNTYVCGAFGRLGDGSAKEANIFENCYAVCADNFALLTYGAARATKNFDDSNGNKNFETVFDLFADETASALARAFGLTYPEIAEVSLSEEAVTVVVNATQTLHATALTAEGTAVKAKFVWSSSDEETVTVENGTIKGIKAGTAVITASFGTVSAQCTVTVSDVTLEALQLENFTYAYNSAADCVIEGNFSSNAICTGAQSITAKILGKDGNYIDLSSITLSGDTLTIPAAQFASANMPTKSVEMTIYFDGVPMAVNGMYLIYTINTLAELQGMKSRLTSDFDGHLLLGADIDFSGVTITTSWGMRAVAFKGIFDGGLHTISNLTVPANASQFGLLGNMQKGSVAKNIKMTNVSLSIYGGGITYLNNGGKISNCYVSGSIIKDGLSSGSSPQNFGCGLLFGRSYSASAVIENCIVEVISHGELYDGTNTSATIYGAAAFGMMGASFSENKMTNCYAVNADGFALCTNTKPSTFKNFANESNGNFATMDELLADETAAALAASLGLTDAG